jgi:hypothetical protein
VASPATIRPDGLLYEFLQRELWQEDVWLFQSLASRLIVKLGIWVSPATYARLPWLVPYARRDPNSRGSKKGGQPDQWGSAYDSGYFRDDNSLLKGLPRSMPVQSSLAAYSGKQLGTWVRRGTRLAEGQFRGTLRTAPTDLLLRPEHRLAAIRRREAD